MNVKKLLTSNETNEINRANQAGRARPGLRLIWPVEACPSGSGCAVAFDAPFGGQCADDVESMVSGGVGGGWCPWAAVVFDFDAGVVVWADLGPDGEGAAGQAGVAVEGGVGGQFGGAEDHLICHGAR